MTDDNNVNHNLSFLHGIKKAAEVVRHLLFQSRRIGDRLYVYAVVRFLVVIAIAAGAFFASYVVGVENLPVMWLLGVAGSLGIYNTIVFLLVKPFRDRDKAAAHYNYLVGLMHGTIMLDFIFLTMALWLVGGAKSPFQAFYLFHVILASVFLSRRAAFAQTLFGYALLAALVLGQWTGWIPSINPPGAVNSISPLDGRYALTVLVVYGILFALSALILTSLMALLRMGERHLIEANEKLERLSAMRRDFLHIVLHDLKSPVAAISQHVMNLEATLEGSLNPQQAQWLERCKVRLKDQMDFLHDLEMLALLETDSVLKDATPMDLAKIFVELESEYQDLARARNQSLIVDVPGDLHQVKGVPRLVREAVANLIGNAVKYTPDGGRIYVRAINIGAKVRIEVHDTGVGIAPEDHARLFREFVRLQPKTATGSQGTSSGLGLSIVRRIAEAHGGSIDVCSEVNKGSTFILELPAAGMASNS
ncbi:MAG TPA: HAMP domain-containing sensor histidine kinase [Candidatus Hydrogenedentes bacterium]|nr:HAMP domain-containing sensor histidine kinase [Candidatus Hydrogenedentota bacterium]